VVDGSPDQIIRDIRASTLGRHHARLTLESLDNVPVERVFAFGDAGTPRSRVIRPRRAANPLAMAGNANLLINLGAIGWLCGCTCCLFGTGVRDYRKRRVVLAGYCDFRGRGNAFSNLPLVLLLREQPVGPVPTRHGDGQEEDSHGYADEDPDRQAKLIEEFSIVGGAHALKYELPLDWKTAMNMITGLFSDRDGAERAYQSVVERGYDASDISLVISEKTRSRYFAGASRTDTDLARKATADAEKEAARELGGPVGGTLGTVGAALAALGTAIVLPGLGIAVAGPVAAALVAAGSVGLAGGLIGALTHWGIPKTRIEQYEAGVRAGGILLGVTARSDEDARHIEREWKAIGGEHVHT
jgi:hypothetical protein